LNREVCMCAHMYTISYIFDIHIVVVWRFKPIKSPVHTPQRQRAQSVESAGPAPGRAPRKRDARSWGVRERESKEP